MLLYFDKEHFEGWSQSLVRKARQTIPTNFKLNKQARAMFLWERKAKQGRKVSFWSGNVKELWYPSVADCRQIVHNFKLVLQKTIITTEIRWGKKERELISIKLTPACFILHRARKKEKNWCDWIQLGSCAQHKKMDYSKRLDKMLPKEKNYEARLSEYMWIICVKFMVQCKGKKFEDSKAPVTEKKLIYAGEEW